MDECRNRGFGLEVDGDGVIRKERERRETAD